MQTINVIPWELVARQHAFYDKLVFMKATLRESDTLETEPRRRNTVPDPIPAAIFPFFHKEPDPNHHPEKTRIQMLIRGTYMGQHLKVSYEDCRDGITDEEAYVEAAFYLSYDIANWFQCAAHFFFMFASCETSMTFSGPPTSA